MALQKSTLAFLKELRKNNNREWFAENKPRYVEAQKDVKQLVAAVEALLNKHDVIESAKTFRIYRDVRFSKDKSPYKTNIGSYFVRATEARRGGLYINIEPGNVFVGGGFWAPNSPDLKRIRQELAYDPSLLRKWMKSKQFKDRFGDLQGDAVKTAPKGYAKDHENIDLLRYKQFLVTEKYTDKDALDPSFAKKCSDTFKAMRPFLDYFSDVLTTDENGESIL